MKSPIKILIVDDHALVRDGLKSILGSQDDLNVVGEAIDATDAVKKVKKNNPDIVLMDIVLGKGKNGIEAATEIVAAESESRIIFLSMDISERYISQAISCGAWGYIPKDTKKGELFKCIRDVHGGKKVYGEKVTEIAINRLYSNASNKSKQVEIKALSEREIEVLTLIADGIPNKAIADQLCISTRTVDAHRANILQKLKLQSTADLVKYAIKHELTSIED